VIGDDRVMWASDYPHADSTWPDSQKAIAANFKDVADPARRRILCDNARAVRPVTARTTQEGRAWRSSR